jgi:phosphate transport system permease protein
MMSPRERLLDLAVAALAWLAATAVVAVAGWILLDLAWAGSPHLSWGFLTEAPRDAGRAGGVLPILASTLALLALALGASAPLALGAGILLAELTRGERRLRALVRRSLEILAGVPSVVFGLFGSALFGVTLGMGFSLLSGGLTLACMILPLLIRAVEQSLRAVPDDYRLAAAALGLSRAATLRRVLLPAATPGLVVGAALGVGRALGETAALLFTSGYVDRMPSSPLDSGRALSVHIYDLSMNVPGGAPAASASALTLVALIVALNTLTAWAAERWLGHTHTGP